MDKKAALIGFVLGSLGGAFLVWPMAFMGMLGHSFDPLLHALHLSPFVVLGSSVGNSFSLFIVVLAAQVLGFWGVLGALVSQRRLAKARRIFFILLVVHYIVAAVLASGDLSYQIGSLGLINYLPYAIFMSCAIVPMVFAWVRARREGDSNAFAGVRAFFHNLRRGNATTVLAGLVVLAVLGVAGQRVYRHFVPFHICTLDLETGEVTVIGAAGDTYVCGVDKSKHTFTTYKQVEHCFHEREISFDGKLVNESRLEDQGLYSAMGYFFRVAYSVETGRFAQADDHFRSVVFKPGSGVKHLEPFKDVVNNVFWASKDTLLVVNTRERRHVDDEDLKRLPWHFRDAYVQLVNVETKQCQVLLDGIVCSTQAIELSPNARQLAFVHRRGEENVLELLDVTSGERRVMSATDKGTDVSGICWSPDSQRVAWANVVLPPRKDKYDFPAAYLVLQWMDLASPVVQTVSGKGAMMGLFTFCGLDKLAFVGPARGRMSVVDLKSGETKSYTVPDETSFVWSLDDGQTLLLGRL